jgi:hypothetical protein
MRRNNSLILKGLAGLFGLLAVGCAPGFGSGVPSAAPEPDLIGACNPLPCIRASIGTLPELPSDLSPALRELVERDVQAALYAPINSDDAQPTKDALMTELQTRYDEGTQPGMSDTLGDWEITRSATVLFQNADVISLDIHSEGFLGGAHGFSERRLMTFDVKSGRRLTIAELVSPSSRAIFEKLVENEFRRAREVPAKESLSQAGFFVKPGEPIAVPDNFGITPGGLVIHYNPYEIAPYVFGATEIVVPMEAFRGVLSDDLKSVVVSLGATAPKA